MAENHGLERDGPEGAFVLKQLDRAQELIAEGSISRAASVLEETITKVPNSAKLYFTLGEALSRLGLNERAINAFAKATKLAPDYVQGYLNLGALLLRQGALEEALKAFQTCVSLAPELAAGHMNLGLTYKNMGHVGEALSSIRQALKLAPDWPEAYYNLGGVLALLGDFELAASAYLLALERRADWPEGHNALGTIRMRQGRLEEAVALYERAVAAKPDWYLSNHNLGVALQRVGREERAIECFRRAIACQPDDWSAHVNIGCLLLKYGNFSEGWREWAWRYQSGGVPAKRKTRDQPIWQGERFDGRTLLLCAEAGLGDMIQFVRFAPMVKALGGTVIIESPPNLARLFTTCAGVDAVITPDDSCRTADLQFPLIDVPRLFGIEQATIPANVPYLRPPPEERLGVDEALLPFRHRFKVGIVWTGHPNNTSNPERSCSPVNFAYLNSVPSVKLFSLQFGDPGLMLDQLKEFLITPLSFLLGDFASTAAVVSRMDLIITVDTSMAHLAGALGMPVWTILQHPCDWRWMVERLDSPWYPTMRLFRQQRSGDWESVFDEVGRTLNVLVAERNVLKRQLDQEA